MSMLRNILHTVAVGAALLVLSAPARADGIAVAPGALNNEASAKLKAQIEAARSANPAAFAAVQNVKGHRPEHYRNNRNPFPTVSRELRGLGPAALMPMLEALAFAAPERGSLTDAEWDALAVGMFEAVGMLRDARARPVLLAAFEAKGLRSAVRLAAARAAGRLGGDPELALLKKHAVAGDPLELFAIHGLGQLRRLESAQHLAARLGSTKDAEVAHAAAQALGVLGSSWAWQAAGPDAAQQGLAVRKACAEALAPSYVKRGGKARVAIGEAILMVDHPDTVALLRAAGDAKVVDALIRRVERQRKRRR